MTCSTTCPLTFGIIQWVEVGVRMTCLIWTTSTSILVIRQCVEVGVLLTCSTTSTTLPWAVRIRHCVGVQALTTWPLSLGILQCVEVGVLPTCLLTMALALGI